QVGGVQRCTAQADSREVDSRQDHAVEIGVIENDFHFRVLAAPDIPERRSEREPFQKLAGCHNARRDQAGTGASTPAHRFMVLSSSRPQAFRYTNSCVRYAAHPQSTRLTRNAPRVVLLPNITISVRKSASDMSPRRLAYRSPCAAMAARV